DSAPSTPNNEDDEEVEDEADEGEEGEDEDDDRTMTLSSNLDSGRKKRSALRSPPPAPAPGEDVRQRAADAGLRNLSTYRLSEDDLRDLPDDLDNLGRELEDVELRATQRAKENEVVAESEELARVAASYQALLDVKQAVRHGQNLREHITDLLPDHNLHLKEYDVKIQTAFKATLDERDRLRLENAQNHAELRRVVQLARDNGVEPYEDVAA
ncbi:hypothetical protein LTR86_004540, partial [Recurvomyces mirabilis]